MNSRVAIEALSATLLDIAKILEDAGLETKTKCAFSDIELAEASEDSPRATGLWGEIIFSLGENAGVLECAVSVYEGEVSDEEMLSEITSLRAEAKRIAELAHSVGKDKLFEALDAPDEPDKDDAEGFDEAKFDEVEFDKLYKEVKERGSELRAKNTLPLLIGGVALIAIVALILIILL